MVWLSIVRVLLSGQALCLDGCHVLQLNESQSVNHDAQNHDEIDTAFDQEKLAKLTQLINELRADNIL